MRIEHENGDQRCVAEELAGAPWLERLGWSQDQAAQALGLAHRNSIAKFESGERPIDRRLELACRRLEEHQEAT
jgi:hypothetical protein